MADSSVSISKNAVITYTCKFKQGTKSWTTQIISHTGPHDCISLDPRNRGLVQLVAEQCGVSLDAEDQKRVPSLAHARGFLDLKEARNMAQAKSLVMATPQARLLFEVSQDPQPKKPRRSREQAKDMRSEARLFDVWLPGDRTVWLQRPIYDWDGVVAWLDANNVETILQFIIEKGIIKDDLFTRRGYKKNRPRPSRRHADNATDGDAHVDSDDTADVVAIDELAVVQDDNEP